MDKIHEGRGQQFFLCVAENRRPGGIQPFEITIESRDCQEIERLVEIAVAFRLGGGKGAGKIAYLVV